VTDIVRALYRPASQFSHARKVTYQFIEVSFITNTPTDSSVIPTIPLHILNDELYCTSDMPYTIYIPRPYQSRTHIIPPLWTTTASSIAISTASPLAKAIYNDAITWGWHTEVTEQDPQEWRIYVKFARRQGW
jgi:hypothetical protein